MLGRLGRIAARNVGGCLGLVLVGAHRVDAQPSPPPAGESPIVWQLQAPARPGTALPATLVGRIPDGWYLYSLTQPAGGPTRTELSVLTPWRLAGAIGVADPQPYPDRNFNIMSEVYTDSVRFTLPVTGPRATDAVLQVVVRYQTCTSRFCLPARSDTVTAGVAVATTASASATARETPATITRARETPQATLPLTLVPAAPASSASVPTVAPAQAAAPIVAAGTTTSSRGLVFTAITTALLALLTPCVFPMIPITVGFFSGRPDRSARAIRRELLTFASGIVAAFVALGVGVSLLLGATGAFTLAANPWVNLVVAALFAGFALQLAGVVQFRAPHRVVTTLTAATHAGQGTPMLLLMGVTFALTSFTCTAPFVGSLLVLAASGGVAAPLVGVLAFAVTFATPFVVLALAPALAGRLPRSGPWLETMKRVAAFAELAVVVKFISNAGMVWGWPWMTREVVIAAWLMLLVALLLWLVWPSPPRAPDAPTAGGRDGPTVARMLRLARGAAVAALGVWLARGLFGHTLGELESYLPPRAGAVSGAAGELPWTLNDWPAVTARAAATQRPILVDFTGYTCTNCRWMEANMFTRPSVQAMLARFERARLFTDGTGEPYRSQQALQADRFGSVALPLYVVVRPDGRLAAQFLGMTRDEQEFLAFLAAGASAVN